MTLKICLYLYESDATTTGTCYIVVKRFITSPPEGVRIANIMTSMSDGLSVCPVAYLRNHTELLCMLFVAVAIGPSMTALRYVTSLLMFFFARDVI